MKISSVEIPQSLTQSEQKRKLYSVDTYFREAFEDIHAFSRLRNSTTSFTSIIFKPEAVAGRRIERGLSFLRDNGFDVVAAQSFRYNRFIIREAWRYQFNVATRSRIRIVDILETASDSLYVMLFDKATPVEQSATERLSKLKGPSTPIARVPGQLRHHLGLISVLLNFVHTGDDSADFVRELGIYFDDKDRAALLEAADAHRREASDYSELALSDAVNSVYETAPNHDLSFADSICRLKEACRSVPNALQQLEALAKRSDDNWQYFLQTLYTHEIEFALWDFLVVATDLISSNLSDVNPLL